MMQNCRSIALAAYFRRDQVIGGVYSVLQNLLRGLSQLSVDKPSCPCARTTVFEGPAELVIPPGRFERKRLSTRLGRFGAETILGASTSREFTAVLFPNYFTPPVVRSQSHATIIHDLQYRHLPEFFSAGKRTWLEFCHRQTLRRACTIIAISEWVKQDIVKWYGERYADRIRVIWNPISFDRLEQPADERFSEGRPFVLCLAADRPQKNLYTLIRAFNRIKDAFPDHLLILAGQLRSLRRAGKELSPAISVKMPATVDLVKDLGLESRVRITGFISDAELGQLYRQASLFVFPSLFEGFGMPAVEALAMGTPALISDLPVLREVTMDSAQYVEDPRDEGELADRIAFLLRDPEVARPTSETKNELRRRFAPAEIARQYLDVLLGNLNE